MRKNDEDGQEEFVFPFNEEILPSVDVQISVDMPRNFEDVRNFEVPKLHGVAKSDGNVEDPKIGKIFELESHHNEDTISSYCDIDSPLDNDKIPPSKKYFSLQEMDRVLNLVCLWVFYTHIKPCNK